MAYEEFIASYGRRISRENDQKETISIRVLMDNLGLYMQLKQKRAYCMTVSARFY